MGLVVLWPVGGAPVQRVPDRMLLGLLDQLLQETVVDTLGQEDPPRRDAVLSLVEEDGVTCLLDGFFEVGIGKNNQWRLSTQLEGHLLHVRLGTAEYPLWPRRRKSTWP